MHTCIAKNRCIQYVRNNEIALARCSLSFSARERHYDSRIIWHVDLYFYACRLCRRDLQAAVFGRSVRSVSFTSRTCSHFRSGVAGVAGRKSYPPPSPSILKKILRHEYPIWIGQLESARREKFADGAKKAL